MRIRQLYSAFGSHFKIPFMEKYGMVPYTNINLPVVMFGCYGSQIDVALKNRATVKVIWAGSDCSNFIKHPEWVEKVKQKDNIFHIAISNFIVNDLNKVGIKYEHIPIVPFDNKDITPHPCGDSIYMYKPSAYNPILCRAIKKELPQFNYIETWHNTFSRQELIEQYKKCFIGLRFTNHDGLANTAVELGLMGRMIIWNGCTPNAIKYNSDDLKSIKQNILKEYELRNSDNYLKVGKEMYDYINIGDDFLNI